MPLPPLLRHVYNHGSDEVIRRGKKIFADGGVSLLDRDPAIDQVRFRVRNDQYHNHYTVTVSKALHPKELNVRCQCPYNLGDICRHEVAALFTLSDMVQGGFFEGANLTYDQRHTVVRLRPVSEAGIRVYTTPETFERAEELAASGAVRLSRSEGGRVEGSVENGGETFPVAIRLNDERYFDTSCSCAENASPICLHKAAILLHTLRAVGAAAFAPARAPDEQKSRLLAQYGYGPDDDLTGKFAFSTEGGKIFLRVLDPSIRKIAAAMPASLQDAPVEFAEPEVPQPLGLVIEEGAPPYPEVWFAAVTGEVAEGSETFSGPLKRLVPADAAATAPDTDRELLTLLRKLTPEEAFKYLRKALPFADFYDDYRAVLTDDAPAEVRDAVWDYLLPKYNRLAALTASRPLVFIRPRGTTLQSAGLKPAQFDEIPVEPRLRAAKSGDDFTVELRWRLDGVPVGMGETTMLNAGLLCYERRLYTVKTPAQAVIVEHFGSDGKRVISAEVWPQFLENTLLPWRASLQVDFTAELVTRTAGGPPQVHIYLRERGNLLLFEPVFLYEGIRVPYGQAGEAMEAQNGKVRLAVRDAAAEETFISSLSQLHTDMRPVAEGFSLPAEAVLSGGWAFQFLDRMKEAGVKVHGWDTLKTLRINPHRPETKVLFSSGIDWFDAQVEIHFGDQRATVTDVKRALAQRQQYVVLPDGSLGMLTDDWLRKYALLLKVGEAQGDKLRLKKFHFGVLDQLLSEVSEDDIQQELQEKRGRLAAIVDRDFSGAHPPEGLTADLRPYQVSGFQWLLFLKEAGWGGILADDMGLGKTVQALALFQHLKGEDAGARFLVVCPTTLLYNWEAETRKFTPGLKPLIHHGPKRATGMRGLRDADIIITTYGTVRSDIKWLREHRWTCAVLDESQAIKNPQSQSAKAAQLLQADHRLALSGTPLQNNTFDLYSQMHFLNPGLLGSREKFASEFATPIDKFGEEDIKEQLRRLIHPFILRRTKEAVASDLPAKTETTFWCEMGPEQRRVYDTYRLAYRDKLLGLIDEQGIDKAQFHILQGLTRLRQICDSPSLIGEGGEGGPHSVKLDEVVREIGEGVGEHKALVFSQFLGMLALIRVQLEKAGIPYAYFDGSTSTADREAAVRRFQDDAGCRVFLVSLKAGGVGLNLTAADYVYIVDPWWNPAVEQQAIDRTHRIGQTKAVFAYRMICRDSIEEKMLQLQDRKRTLAADLVTDDGAFLKRLTREDVAFLLS